ncbi:hypothetical protein JD78_01661 [Modestobacter roseus]|uniref:Uncharacterized protein n=1 Tax=Modestobacter roseus TaxID=1181884 RepID=A0A562IQE3_9ACTN|nr:hypothetical protein [Modestobacter roseus]TWH73138.1 hypothetical protein JD78_01661 [Modestobacter roseus]
MNLGGSGADTAEFSSAALRSRSADVLGYTNNALTAEQRAGALTAVLGHAAAGALGVEHEVRPLDRGPEAWAATAAGGVRQVLVPA